MIFFLIYSSALSPQSIPFAIRRVAQKRSAFIEVDERGDNRCLENMLKLAIEHKTIEPPLGHAILICVGLVRPI